MNRRLCYVMGLGLALSLSSCGKKLGQFSADYFTVNPNPLEVVGEKVPARVSATIPAKFFVKNAEVTVTPTLVFNGKEVSSQSYSFQGEKVRGNNPVISYENGGTATIPVSFKYQPDMAKSELMLNFTVNQNGKQYVLPAVKVANGVVATAALADAAGVTPALAPDAFQRIINEKYAADIMFLINQANIRAGQLKSDAMAELQKEIIAANGDTSRVLEEINISSYASPDGGVKLNTRLAENREKNTKAYMTNQLKKDKITEFGELTAQFTAQDWEGFQKLVSQSNIQDKDLILSVLKMYKDPEQREKEIRNLSSVFDELADQILPQLRYSRIQASINVIGKSDEEMIQLFNTDPSKLTEDEILYVATLTNDNTRKMEVYQKASQVYPNSYRAFNNLGLTKYEAGDYAVAKSAFEKAKKLDPSSKEVDMNLGLIQLLDGNYNKANELLGAAAGVPETSDALGVYYLTQGEVAKANTAFGNAKTNNAALAKILSKDYSAAQSVLSAVANPDATTYYLAAIVGARTNNESAVLSNLKKAISLDKNMLKQAQSDLEFAKFNLNSL